MARRTKGPRYYTTGKSATEFVTEILQLLGDFGVESYHVQQSGGKPVAIAFTLAGLGGLLPFRLIPDIAAVKLRLQVAVDRGDISSSDIRDSEAVGWAQTRHLLELQLEAIESGLVSAAQVFGGLAITSEGRTVAEMLEERAGELLPGEQALLPPPR